MIRVVTVSREYGSGGAEIARALASRLQWRLVDNLLIDEIARVAQVNRGLAEKFDESIDPWFHRLLKALWRGGYEGTVARSEGAIFDAEAMTDLWHRVILQAAEVGQSVIVGRGGQCLLQSRRDAFHVSVYAPYPAKIRRLRERLAESGHIERLMEETDRRRAAYIRHHFGQDWTNRHLYHLMICSSIGVHEAVEAILVASGLAEVCDRA